MFRLGSIRLSNMTKLSGLYDKLFSKEHVPSDPIWMQRLIYGNSKMHFVIVAMFMSNCLCTPERNYFGIPYPT